MELKIPDFCLLLLVGASGSGKSSFARKHFLSSEVISSDACRGWVSDDENNQEATTDAFELLRYMTEKRLKNRKLTVIDATNVQEHARKELIRLAQKYHAQTAAIVFNIPPEICIQRNEQRPDRQFGPHVVLGHTRDLRRSLRGMEREGVRHLHVLRTVEDVEAAEIIREPLWTDRHHLRGPFDIIGDIHGCFEELLELLTALGYRIEEQAVAPLEEGAAPRHWEAMNWFKVQQPEGRTAVFLGDLVDRGPDSPRVLKLVMSMVAAGQALAVPGNHDVKLVRKLGGRDVRIAHGLAETLEQLERESEEFSKQVRRFLDGLISHFVLDDWKLVVAHAGMKEEMQGRASGAVREFAMFGETTGETDEFGLPVRYNWAAEYRGKARVVYGHTPVPEADWLNGTINIDTGCVFGGKLTALRYPEMELVSVPAKQTYAESAKPFLQQASDLSSQHAADDALDLQEVMGRRHIQTALRGTVIVGEHNSTAALEAMSRFAANPKWVVYLPPTMSPSETSQREGYLEYPEEAFVYFREQGVPKVICEEKHMGSRAVVVVCMDEDTAVRRFGVVGEGRGVIYTRTGRRFFDDPALESEILSRLVEAMTRSGFWTDLETDWAVLDCELMPWSAKAQELLRRQYAAAGAAASKSTSIALELVQKAEGLPELGELQTRLTERAEMAQQFVEAYRRYCWDVKSIDDYRLAPFHVMATEGRVHHDRDHAWHMETISAFCDDPILMKTPYRVIDVTDADSTREGCMWWEELVSRGGEGMVIKPMSFVARGPKGPVQPAVKCRGTEYLRIIYGPEYTRPEHLERLKRRGLHRKRSLAMREFALGIEGLERFVRREPLRRVHECAFGVLALESEPVDPRL